MKPLPTINQADLSGKRVLVRADLNVPMEGSTVQDRNRILKLLPLLEELLQRGTLPVVMSHLGRPGGKYNSSLSLKPVAEALQEELEAPVKFIPDCLESLDPRKGEILLLENLRFHPGEENSGTDFVQNLVRQGEIYINDALSCCHRDHASITAVPRFLPHFAGPGLRKELNALTEILEDLPRPRIALVAGVKINGKINALKRLIRDSDILILAGSPANVFLSASGISIARSPDSPEHHKIAREILEEAEEHRCRILLPEDIRVQTGNGRDRIYPVGGVPEDGNLLDLGPQSVRNILEVLKNSGSLVWNGPLGAYERKPFSEATFQVARKVRDLCAEGKLVAVAGGGNTAAAPGGLQLPGRAQPCVDGRWSLPGHPSGKTPARDRGPEDLMRGQSGTCKETAHQAWLLSLGLAHASEAAAAASTDWVGRGTRPKLTRPQSMPCGPSSTGWTSRARSSSVKESGTRPRCSTSGRKSAPDRVKR